MVENRFLINGQEAKCKSLDAVYAMDNSFLGGPYECNFSHTMSNSLTFDICIRQAGVKEVLIRTKEEISTARFFDLCQSIENLLMFFEGRFIPLESLKFSDSNSFSAEDLLLGNEWYKDRRLKYYIPSAFCNYSHNKLLNFAEVLNGELFSNWTDLETELDIALSVILYSLSKNCMTVDVNCAFLIEAAETIVELVTSRINLFSSLKPGDRGTTLKMCLDALISKYGTDIFEKEIQSKKDYLKVLVNSRVRVMHIKRKQKGDHLSGSESILYSVKFFALYRKILFGLLGIDEGRYNANLRKLIDNWEAWENIQDDFLNRI